MIGLGILLVAAAIAAAVVASRRHAPFRTHAFGHRPSAALVGNRGPHVDGAIHRKLDEWAAEGLITPAEMEAVEAYEIRRSAERPSRVPLVAEAVGYLGGSLVIASLALVIGRSWDDIAVSGRVAVLAAPALLFAVVGAWVGRATHEALRRFGSVSWVLAGGALAGTLAEVWIDVVGDGDPPERGGVVFVAGITLVALSVAWWVRREPLQLAAMLAASVGTVVGILEVTARSGTEISPTWLGLALFGLAATWLVGGLAQRLTPSVVAVLAGAVLLSISPQFIRADLVDLGLWLGIGSALCLMLVGITTSDVVPLTVGTIGLFQWSPQVALFYLEDVLGAEATLAVIGTLLLVLAGALVRLYPAVRARMGNRTG